MGTLFNRLRRLVHHAMADLRGSGRWLDAAAVQRLTERVAASERRHSGEIRLCIEAGLPAGLLWQGTTPRQRALEQFSALRVWDTEANNGVLIYLLLADRAIEIVSDRGLSVHADAAFWAGVLASLRQGLRSGAAEQGLNAAIDDVDALLCRAFSRRADQADHNELPDSPWLH